MSDLLFKSESYKIIGICMDVHNVLGFGFLEIVYKDAVEYELTKANIPFIREKEYLVRYKETVLPHKFYADFVVYDSIILEIKSASEIANEHLAQALNYLQVSGNRLALIVNFGKIEIEYKRVIY